ncbi:hypothetical protein QMA70_11120 [Burkholderia pseudomallei]|nr:hypothetical protein [Burkholderia pseudomallei]
MSTTNESSPPSLIGRHVTAAALRLPGVPHPASRVRVVQPNRFAIPPIRRFTALPLHRFAVDAKRFFARRRSFETRLPAH